MDAAESEPGRRAAAAAAAAGQPRPEASGAWAPLRSSVFRRLWVAQVVSNVGTWMQTVAAQWLIVTVSGSAALVGLVQTASTLPVVLLAALAGVLADVLDRRRVLVVVQLAMVVAASALAGLTFAGVTNPVVLLGFTFVLGCGTAFIAPAWQAIQPELVPRAQLPQASALGAVNMNLARAIGPALGGALVAAAGAGWVFALNAASFLVVAVAVGSWRRQGRVDPAGRERLLAALRSGARYVRHAPSMRRILLCSLLFVPAASALWALLPVVADQGLHLAANGYGILLGALGAGAIAGTAVLPFVRARMSLTWLLAAAFVVYAGALAALALTSSYAVAIGVLTLAGAAWVAVLSTLMATAQTVLPGWVRARALSYNLVVFFGGQAAGGLVWGVVAQQAGTGTALLAAAALVAVGAGVGLRFPLIEPSRIDPTPSSHWQQLAGSELVDPQAGPVLVIIDYLVRPGDQERFTEAMARVSRSRRRTGAQRWALFHDPAAPERFVETFLVATWGEHERQHSGRLTVTDRLAEERALSLVTQPPLVRHLISASVPLRSAPSDPTQDR